MLQLRPEISQTVGNAVLITGVARSGTTIMGTLIHSLESLEFLFEPPLLYGLFPLLGKLDEAAWKYLYETYLFEDFLLDAMAGRRLNFNKYDDSSIHKVKSPQDVDARLDSRYHRLDLFRQAVNHRIAYKMPDMLPQIDVLTKYYPDMKVVIMFREPEAVVDSLVRKRWFAPESRTSDVIQGPWLQLGPDIPFWVRNTAEWQQASELEKAYLYYIWQNEALTLRFNLYSVADSIGTGDKRYCIVDYDDFVMNPVAEFQKVMHFLGCKPTPKTAELLKTVGYQQQNGTIEQSLDVVNPELRSRVMKILERMNYV